MTSNNDNNSNEEKLPSVQHPEFPVTSDTYLNLYHGVKDVDLEPFSHYTEMSTEQRETFVSFLLRVNKQQWNAITPDELTCLRFLQADKYDADRAFERLVKNQAWLRQVNIPNILRNPPARLQTYRKLRARAHMGSTKEGMPVFVERLGDFQNAISSTEGKALTDQDWIECFLYDLGELLGQIRDSKHASWRATWIMDCSNVKFLRAMKATSVLKLLDALTEPNFPELAGPVAIVQVPSIVMGVWRIIRAFLDPTVVDKIQIHSGLPKDVLLERIDPEVLFEEFGGTNTAVFPKAEYS